MYEMFKGKTNKYLRELLFDLMEARIRKPIQGGDIMSEIMPQCKRSVSSQISLLNRFDLLKIIYCILQPDITKIDTAPIQEIPLLLKEDYRCEELTERVKRRLKDGV